MRIQIEQEESGARAREVWNGGGGPWVEESEIQTQIAAGGQLATVAAVLDEYRKSDFVPSHIIGGWRREIGEFCEIFYVSE